MGAYCHVTIPWLILVGLLSFQLAFPLGNWDGLEWSGCRKILRKQLRDWEDQTYNRSIIRISRLGETARKHPMRTPMSIRCPSNVHPTIRPSVSHLKPCPMSARQQVTELSRKVSRLRTLQSLKESVAESTESDAEKPSQRRKASKEIEKKQ